MRSQGLLIVVQLTTFVLLSLPQASHCKPPPATNNGNKNSNNKTVLAITNSGNNNNNNSSCDISLGCDPSVQRRPTGNIITRTGGIVYKALSNAFSFADTNDDGYGDQEEHTLPVYESHHIATTPASLPVTTSRKTAGKGAAIKKAANSTTSTTTNATSNAQKPANTKANSITASTISKLPSARAPTKPNNASTIATTTSNISTTKSSPDNRYAQDRNKASQNETNKVKEPKKRVLELVSLLSLALQGFLASNVTQLSRSARLATDVEQSVGGNKSTELSAVGKLARITQQLPPNELTRLASHDVQLLCRLLNKAAAEDAASSSAPASSPTTTTTTTTSTTEAPQVAANRSLLVESEADLSESRHASWLLESAFQYNERFLTRQMARKEAERRLLDLFEGEALTSSDESGLGEMSNATGVTPSSFSKGYKLHWPAAASQQQTEVKTNYSSSSQPAISLVFWLLEPIKLAASNQTVWRVFNLASANDLLARHEQAQVERHLQIGHLNPLLLLEGYQADRKWWQPNTTTASNETHLAGVPDRPTRIIDDTLLRPQASDSWPGERLAAKLGFANVDFRDNLYLYLIVLLLIVFLLAMCFACPALLSRPGSRSGSMRGGVVSSNPKQLGAAQMEPKHQFGSGGGTGKDFGYTPSEAAIWRKLSNTTSLLVRDELESLRSQTGSTITPRNPTQAELKLAPGEQQHQQRWLSLDREQVFEASSETKTRTLRRVSNNNNNIDRPTQTCVRKKISKSIQTQDVDTPAGFASSSRLLADSLEGNLHEAGDTIRGSSDTLNKSELVMVKEKMVPISRVERANDRCKPAQAGREPAYLNQDVVVAHKKLANKDLLPSVSYIDSCEQAARSRRLATSGSDGSGASLASSRQQQADFERQAKMRQVDWEPKTRARVDAIKAELGKLEHRDQQQRLRDLRPTTRQAAESDSSTYKRFDTIT